MLSDAHTETNTDFPVSADKPDTEPELPAERVDTRTEDIQETITDPDERDIVSLQPDGTIDINESISAETISIEPGIEKIVSLSNISYIYIHSIKRIR